MAQQRFVATKEHRRFIEFADAVRRQHTIGICYGQAGIGKTLSATRYANWHKAQTLLEEWGPREDSDFQIYAALARKRTVFFTPGVLTTPRQVQQDLADLAARVSICIDQHLETLGKLTGPPRMRLKNIDLLIVDESERLGPSALEYLRDQHDRTNMGLVLIGMPGIEKQFSRYPQLYSRVGFAHEYRPLAEVERRFGLERRWHKLGHTLDPDDFTDAQALAAIARVTHGNFRLVDRLFTQMERIMKINELHTITDDVVEAARSTLVIGI
ncbi:MAG: AAA family ATPase [Yaniella sp.]|uniref:AAA family ATPase n=1 Tax=Yaniella sp. TaxID=2773929 RepID=UPI00264A42B9|nr:AAA family ATPase [Yaniella sp.]MDN5731627.1 AAA family ATPase [Yaniella sp.]MDN5816138.1 AAA family ATPase [Yaniella sp.]MDN5837479.1 AAA family ATPase [Yaniella sp.]MDN5889716.1 AAA family ATPase [Yaniella sp.]MDN5913222.1 AAA family ATPase [Yaniella sp.]